MKKNRSFTFGTVFMIAVYLLTGALCGYFGIAVLDAGMSQGFSFGAFLFRYVVIIAIMLINILLQIVIHEGGHLVFGLLSGYKFVSFRIGSFIIIKTPDGIKLKRFSIVGTGGQCLLAPPEMKADGTFPYILYNLGGSLMNILTANIGLLLFTLFGTGTYAGYFFLSFAIIGGAVALTNGVPLRLGDVNNDGYNALNLGKNKNALPAFYYQLKINAALSENKRLRDMPDEWFSFLSLGDMTDGLTCTIGVFKFSRLADMGKHEEAVSYGKLLLSKARGMLGVHRSALAGELLFFELAGQCREEEIKKLYSDSVKKYLNASRQSPSSARVLYAYELLYNKNEKAAEKHLQQFEKSLKVHPNQGEIDGEKELISLVKAI